jgi:hypothetical protein
VVSQDATSPVLSARRAGRCKARQTLHLFAGMVTLVAECGFVVTCRARILTWGSGSCRLDTPSRADRRPEPRAWSGYRMSMSTACLPACFSRYTLCQSSTSILASNQSSTSETCLKPGLCDTPDTQARARGSAVQARRVSDFTSPW